MKKMVLSIGACALICALSIPAIAHDPPDYRGIIWQWPADKLPVFDGNLRDWDVVPEEFWLTHENYNVDSFVGETGKGALDPADLSFRWMTSFVQGSSKLYWAFERFDDFWYQSDGFEPIVDADHSGGSFWDIEGQSDEEKARHRSRQAQIYHTFFDDGHFMGEALGQEDPGWVWMWMTSADWYGELPYTDSAYSYTGTPAGGGEFTQAAEFMLTGWDDFNFEDPNASVEHEFQEGEIIGLSVNVWDHDGDPPTSQGRWSLTTVGESNVNADFLADFVLTELDEEIMATAVEEDSWGNVKASVSK